MRSFLRHTLLFLILLCCYPPAEARRYRAKDARAKNIDSLLAFRPLVHVALIREGNLARYNDSFSKVSCEMHEEVIAQYGRQMKLGGIVHSADSALNAAIDAEIVALFIAAEDKRHLEDGLACPRIDSVAKAMGMRYVLLLLNVGFLRTKTNYRTEEMKGVLPGLLSLGMYQKVTIPANSNMSGMVLDLQEHRTYYHSNTYGTLATNRQSPVSMPGLDKQFRGLFTTFFWSAPL